MAHASDTALGERGKRRDDSGRLARAGATGRRSQIGEAFLAHYFERIDPAVAASFTEDQRQAILTMFGARGITRHAVELRRSIPFGGRRFYLVFLLGSERRKLARLYRDGDASGAFSFYFYLGLGALCLLPVLILLYGL